MIKHNFQKEIDALSISSIKNFDKYVENYDEQDLDFDGHRVDKKFVRVDSKCFEKLLKEIQNNPECSYVTYMNPVIKQGFIPKKLSCFLKPLRYDKFGSNDDPKKLVVNEVLSSQIMNYFECPTVYNAVTTIKTKKCKDLALLSVDFLNMDDEFKTFTDLTVYSSGLTFPHKCGLHFSKLPEDIYNQFAYSFLIRYYLLHDDDFRDNNIGELKNKETNKKRAINYDYEFTFEDIMPSGTREFVDTMVEGFRVAKQFCPKELDKFLQKCLYLDFALEKISKRDVEYVNSYHKNLVCSRLKRNLRLINEAIEIMELENYNFK